MDFIADLEHALKTSNLEENMMDNICHQVSHHLLHHQMPADITKAEQQTLKWLREDKSIVILPADKRQTTVVMNKTNYINKANYLPHQQET